MGLNGENSKVEEEGENKLKIVAEDEYLREWKT